MKRFYWRHYDTIVNAGTGAAILLAANAIPLILLACGIRAGVLWAILLACPLMAVFTALTVLLIVGRF